MPEEIGVDEDFDPTGKTLIYDVEADGLRPTKIHCITIHDADSDFEFSAWKPESISKGVRLLERAAMSVAHFGIGYDFKVIRKLENFSPIDGHVERDSYVACAMLMGDIKEVFDYEAMERTKKDPEYGFKKKWRGKHGLDAWGFRIGLAKGDYSEWMKSQGLDPWAEFNPFMFDYMRNDGAVLKILWNERIRPLMEVGDPVANERALKIEHFMAREMQRLEEDGILFDRDRANEMCDGLMKKRVLVEKELVDAFGGRYEPKKWIYRRDASNGSHNLTPLQWTFPGNLMWHPRTDADLASLEQEREMWGQWVTPAKRPGPVKRLERRLAKLYKQLNYVVDYWMPDLVNDLAAKISKLEAEKRALPPDPIPDRVRIGEYGPVIEEGSFTPIVYKKVSVGSRKQVARRLIEMGWHPTELTPTGDPKMSEDEMDIAAETFPLAKRLGFYYLINKRLSQAKIGKTGWLKMTDRNGFIHPTIRPCAAVTARATHSHPNMSAVPAVESVKDPTPDNPNHTRIAWGEEGVWGADCRACFTVPPGFKQVGADLKGIELRCLAEELWDYDSGAFYHVLDATDPDFHERNRQILKVANRTVAKRFIFAWLYGGGDEMLGEIVFPTRTPSAKKAAGAILRQRIVSGIKGVRELLMRIKRMTKNPYVKTRHSIMVGMASFECETACIPAIDGRLLGSRGAHSALNTRLQSAGAIIAKYWIYCIIKALDKLGWKRGYDGDYVFMLWSHDEIQFAIREDKAEQFAKLTEDMALKAGQMLKFRVPIEAEAKIGDNWMECH